MTTFCLCFGSATAAEQKVSFEPVVTKLVVPATKPQTLKVDLNGATDLYLVAEYGKDSYDSDQAIWAEPVLYDAEGKVVKLTTLQPASFRVGWGELYVDRNHTGSPLSISGETFKFGFFAHAPSIIHFKLGGKYKSFETKVGLDNGSARGSVVFQVRNTPTAFPSVDEYSKNYPKQPKSQPPIAPPANEVEFALNPEAAKKLVDRGIDELLFIRRFTYTSNHVYTDHVNSKWAPGGGICAVNLKTEKIREIVPELTRNGVVGWFDLSFDAKKIVFDLKKGNGEGYRIYEVNVDGTGLRQLTFPLPNESELIKKYHAEYHHGTDDVDPCYLPDGRIVFASTRCQFSVLCDAGDNLTVKNIFRMNADGSDIKQLTYSPLSEATPTVHNDGRILYHRWEYVDKAAGNCKSIWSMNPDGSGTAEVYGNTITFPETKIQARAIPNEPNKIVMLGASHWINNALGSVIVVDTTKNIRSTEAMKYITDDVAAF
ncbi:MAG: NPCBM/NEW2 domain-containing protein, partial [Planctomycetaceae bacterium]|nr:NPCBM/NEW2 domain-containing protein [Planctomycetaceae bacterium]